MRVILVRHLLRMHNLVWAGLHPSRMCSAGLVPLALRMCRWGGLVEGRLVLWVGALLVAPLA